MTWALRVMSAMTLVMGALPVQPAAALADIEPAAGNGTQDTPPPDWARGHDSDHEKASDRDNRDQPEQSRSDRRDASPCGLWATASSRHQECPYDQV